MDSGFFSNWWWWIVGVVNDLFDPIQPPTKDLSEIARIEIEKKLKDIKKVYNSEFDIEKRKQVCRVFLLRTEYVTEPDSGDVSDHDSEEESLQTDMQQLNKSIFQMTISEQGSGQSSSAIQSPRLCDNQALQHPEIELLESIDRIFHHIRRGRIFTKKFVSVKAREHFRTQHILVAAKLRHHKNILGHLFDFSDGYRMFAVSENFDFVLSKLYVPTDLKLLTRQVCSGLDYLHEEGIAHGKIKATNVFACVGKNQKTFKIANFEQATINASSELLRKDVQKLGKMLMFFRVN